MGRDGRDKRDRRDRRDGRDKRDRRDRRDRRKKTTFNLSPLTFNLHSKDPVFVSAVFVGGIVGEVFGLVVGEVAREPDEFAIALEEQ